MACKLLGLVCVLWIYLYIPATDSLWCYQCADVKTDSSCLNDVKGMNKSAITMAGRYAKDCSNQFKNQDNETEYYCLIERHFTAGDKMISFRRDCSDGVHFSYNYDPATPKISGLQNLRPNNQSSCLLVVDKLICLSLCNEDFCNGPKPNRTWEECIPHYFANGTNITCGSTSQLYTRYPIVFGTVIDGIMGNILSAPFFVCLILTLVLY